MTLTELRTAVRSVLEDTQGFRYTDPIVDRYARDAYQYVARQLGRTQGRTALNLVSGQQEYDLPAGIRKIVSIKILPESGSEPYTPLQQVELDQMPITTESEGDPTRFSLNAAGGADGQNLSIFVWPVPDRSASSSIIVTYDVSFEVTAEVPFTEEYELIIVRLTASGCLSEQEDQTSLQKAQYLDELAKRDLADMVDLSALNANDSLCRAFP